MLYFSRIVSKYGKWPFLVYSVTEMLQNQQNGDFLMRKKFHFNHNSFKNVFKLWPENFTTFGSFKVKIFSFL